MIANTILHGKKTLIPNGDKYKDWCCARCKQYVCEVSAACMGKTGLTQHAGNDKLIDCRKRKKINQSVEKIFNSDDDVTEQLYHSDFLIQFQNFYQIFALISRWRSLSRVVEQKHLIL